MCDAQAQQLVWLHTIESTRRLYRLVETGRATIQCTTISLHGWPVAGVVHRPLPAGRPTGETTPSACRRHGRCRCRRHPPGHPVPPDPGRHRRARPCAEPAPARREAGPDCRSSTGGSPAAKGSRTTGSNCSPAGHGCTARSPPIRKTAHHRLANELAARFDTVVIEDLNIRGMTHNRPLARALADAGLGQFRQILTTECADRGTRLVTVDRWYPSSKTCSTCGAVKAKLSLTIRVFDCDTCGTSLDRDVNAALNLEHAPAACERTLHHR